ncbi:MAG: AzlD domain-containing protein [Candidatus Puniceispirillum sp.]|jgi:branched-subunit amino acid transport protein|uniref:AzlD domain-containing protein n=1 Tax=Candidatus Puniceispirillum sp. TaxID=2026719 RepID=UPI001EBA999F|nr:AzlD domain-containing protein [Candidatus Puniceispirillum sp.]MBT6416036.1 AzlD domain-containing protein [Candidatus Puniceispirillum sp.]MBT6566871.1 AzlD domain-containing protein [Candidatus Puniceispirillum sp.]
MIWIVMIATGLINFATRFSMFSGFAPKQLPNWLEDALGFVPIAVLTAIIAPAVLFNETGTITIVDNTRVYAALVAIIVALITRSVLATISTGLIALWTLTYFGL